MFGKNDNQSNERIIYEAKPNLILSCKKAILGFILLIIALSVSGPIIQYIGHMQVYLISYIKLPLTRYAAVAVFVIILIIILYIIWQIMGWYSKEYILTESKIVVKSGIVLTRKNSMPYSTIQDINTSQSIFARLFNVGSISAYSAYDNNQVALEYISNPSKVEEIIFSNMNRNRGYYQPPHQNLNANYQQDYYQPNQNGNYQQDYYQSPNRNDNYQQDYYRPNQNGNYQQDYYQSPQQEYYPEDDYYDDDVVITPIRQEEQYQRRQYDYYPEDLNYNNAQQPKYEYEPYNENLENNIDRAMNNEYESYGNSPDPYNDASNYNGARPDYSNGDDYYYQENENKFSYNEDVKKDSNSQKNNVDESSESVIKRHFDKFKK